ncbi:MAG TPA: hypothetical protein PLV68_19415, partial [Ilumatobacteraceae bacterium]|nr:hypothetical protein [Ilumatobacteraceae bacterium]
LPDNFELKLSILFLAAVVLGGPGNMGGVILGAVLVSYMPEKLRFLNTSRYFWFGMVLMIMMIFRPQGLLPSMLKSRAIGNRDGPPPDGGDAIEPEEVDTVFHDVSEGDPDLQGGAHGVAPA